MIEMATGRRFSSASSNTSANPPGNSSSSSSSSSSLSTSLRDGVVIVDIGNNNSNNNNNNNNNTCNNRFVGGLSRMKRFQILLWVTMVFTFFHLRRNLPNVSPPQIEKKNSNKSTKISPAITTATVVTTSPPPTSSPLMKPTSTTATTTPTATSDKSSIDSSTIMTTATDVETIIVEKEDEYIDDHRETQKPNIDNNDIANNDSDSDSEKQQPTTMTPQPSSPPIQVPQIINSEESSTDNKPSKKDENGVDAIKTTETASKAPILTNSSSSSSSTLPKVRTDNDLTPIERKFADTHCDLTHLKNNEWYPSSLSEEDGDDDSWQQRAPYIIIAGVWNAGINPIANALFTHPQIDKAKTNGFFLPKQFQRYYDVGSNNDVNNNNDNDNNNNNNNNSTSTTEIASSSSSPSFNIKVFAARERMYAQVYSKSTLREKAVNDEESKDILGRGEDNNDNKNNHVAMDVSPGLIFYAHRTAHSILCTVPWVKIVIVLRNPIDRLYQQWSYSTNNLGLTLSLEDWMAQEMKLLHTVGLIGASTSNSDVNNNKNKNNINDKDKDSVLTVVSEKEAWEKYQSVRNVAGAMGRSLYVLQLEEWINAYIAAGKNPSDFITILTTENIEDQPQKEYNKLIQFLHLAPITENNNDIDDKNNIASTLLEKSFNKTKNNVNKNDLTPPMKEETRNMLRHFFRPYNQRLTKLLRSNGFEGNWDERWK